MSAKTSVPGRSLEHDELAGMARVPEAADERERVALGSGATLRTRDHAAVVYWTSDELLRSVIPYLCAGLRAGDKVVYVAHDHPLDTIAAALRAAGTDVALEVGEERLTLLSADDAFFPDGRFDVERSLQGVRELAADAARRGFERVRFSVEMTYLLADVPGIERGAEFESRANDEIFAKHPFVCVCSFNGARDDNTDVITDVLATHPVLIASGIPLINPHYRPWEALAADPGARERAARRASKDPGAGG